MRNHNLADERGDLKSKGVLTLLTIVGLSACASSPPKPANRTAEFAPADKASELAAEQQQLRLVMTSHGKDFGQGFSTSQDLIAART
jgi:hypothetical protein